MATGQEDGATTAPPATAKAVLALLAARFAELPPALQAAARCLIDNPREAGVQSMRALAQRANVHPNAFVRLARLIGFDGYEDLRERFRDFLVEGDLGGFRDRARWLKDLAARGGSAEIVGQMAGALTANIERALTQLDIRAVEDVADRLVAAPRVHVLGLGGAFGIVHGFCYVAGMAFDHIEAIPRHGGVPTDELIAAGRGEVLVALTVQPYRAETLAAARLAKTRGLTVIGISDSKTAPLAAVSQPLLVCPTHTPHFFPSMAAIAGLMEILIALMIARAGDPVETRIEALHAERAALGLYEEDLRLKGRTG